MENQKSTIKQVLTFFILFFTSDSFCKEVLYAKTSFVVNCTRVSLILNIGLVVHFSYSLLINRGELSDDYLLSIGFVWAVGFIMAIKGIYGLYWRVYKD